MPAQKRSLPPPSPALDGSLYPPPPPYSHYLQQQQQQRQEDNDEEEENHLQPAEEPQQEEEDDAGEEEEEEEDETMDAYGGRQHQEDLQSEMAQEQQEEQNEDDEEEGGGSEKEPEDEYDYDEDEAITDDERLMPVTLVDIRKDVQCSICLGIIRKTRTVMDCLHRFCRECIDKSMRLGNNECPACRTHCASRRSLRDDSNYDSLISVVYADIDKYEEEELAFREEEQSRNRMIQAAIAETYRRQTEALCRRKPTEKATAAAFIRKSQGNYRSHGQNGYLRGRGRNGGHDAALAVSDDEDEVETNVTYGGKESSSAEEPSPDGRHKRCKVWAAPRSSPARASTSNGDLGCVDNIEPEVNRENVRTSPLKAGEMLAWGKNGTRSQTRHGSTSGTNGRMMKGGHMTRLVDHLRNLNETNFKLCVHLTLVPLDKQSTPNLQQCYICCQPTVSVKHLCEFIALQMSVQAEDVQLYVRKPLVQTAGLRSISTVNATPFNQFVDQLLKEQESVGTLLYSSSGDQGELVLAYCLKMQN